MVPKRNAIRSMRAGRERISRPRRSCYTKRVRQDGHPLRLRHLDTLTMYRRRDVSTLWPVLLDPQREGTQPFPHSALVDGLQAVPLGFEHLDRLQDAHPVVLVP